MYTPPAAVIVVVVIVDDVEKEAPKSAFFVRGVIRRQ
jgi:hypothetical protein